MSEESYENMKLPSDSATNSRLNSLRAAVLGANDGLVSVSSVVMGVAGASSDRRAVAVAGMAALIAGALSMMVGEYVSVSSQSDAEKAFVIQEKKELAEDPDFELEELAREYQKLGLGDETSHIVARELTEKDALRAHLHVHFNLNPDDINSPWQAGIASLISFTIGGLIPFLTVLFAPTNWRIEATVAAVVAALVVTGFLSATAGKASRKRAIIRVVVGGILAMVVTYLVGKLFGTVAG